MNKSEIVKNYILTKIKNKEYLPGFKIETIKEIKNKLNVSELTVRNSVNQLKQEKVLYSYQGCGTFVANSLKEENKNILILYHHYLKYDLYKTSRILIEKISSELAEKNYIPVIQPDNFTDINQYLKNNIQSFSGVISVNAFFENLKKLTKNKIPVVETNAISPNLYPTVQYDFIKFHSLLLNIINKYTADETVIFNYFHSIHHLHPTFVIQYAYNKYLEKYNIHLIIENENIDLCRRKFRSVMKSLKEPPKLLVFLDENIYEICLPLFSSYSELLKNTKIITHATRDIETDPDFETVKISFNLNECSKKTCDLLEHLINKDFIPEHIVKILPKIIK